MQADKKEFWVNSTITTILTLYANDTVYDAQRDVYERNKTSCNVTTTTGSILDLNMAQAKYIGLIDVRGITSYQWALPGGYTFFDAVVHRLMVRLITPEWDIEVIDIEENIPFPMVAPPFCPKNVTA
eukprot:Phypoly_transcript_25886.p1 GENE.Phypoly_transcript_25886~~Phypoly_transcript_25886.p1  ORF type:complete len:127 (+),score=19.21 Phypoly_transcript_25886:89-469(+)